MRLYSDQRGLIHSRDGRPNSKRAPRLFPCIITSFDDERDGELDQRICDTCKLVLPVHKMWTANLCGECKKKLDGGVKRPIAASGDVKTDPVATGKVRPGTHATMPGRETTTTAVQPSNQPPAFKAGDRVRVKESAREWPAIGECARYVGQVITLKNPSDYGGWHFEEAHWAHLHIFKQYLEPVSQPREVKAREFRVGDVVQCMPDAEWVTTNEMKAQIGCQGTIEEIFTDKTVALIESRWVWRPQALKLIRAVEEK